MKQTVSILIPFKKHSKKVGIRYDTSLHTEMLQSATEQVDLYPRMKDPYAIEMAIKQAKAKPAPQQKRKSSLKGGAALPQEMTVDPMLMTISSQNSTVSLSPNKRRSSVRPS
jgi:hypothetical protein